MSRRRTGSLSLQTRLVAASVVLAILVAAAFVILILSLATLREATRQEAQSRDVTAEALMLQKLVLDVETGLRGYVLTGQESLLEPLQRGSQAASRPLSLSSRDSLPTSPHSGNVRRL